jgi:hypothetical protein
MGLDNLIKLATALVIAAALTGQLPKATMAIRRAQIQLLHESRASQWGSPDLLHNHSGEAMKTNSLPGRSGAPRTSLTE